MEKLDDLKWATSKKGNSILERQRFGEECDLALRSKGGNANLYVRAHSEKQNAVVVFGEFEPPWTEQDIAKVVTEKNRGRYELVFKIKPV
jgi:hypothetical protein